MSEIPTLDSTGAGRNRAENGVGPALAADTKSPLRHAQAIFAAFDAKDVAALADLMTDDVRLQIGNAEVVNGKAEFAEALSVWINSHSGQREYPF